MHTQKSELAKGTFLGNSVLKADTAAEPKPMLKSLTSLLDVSINISGRKPQKCQTGDQTVSRCFTGADRITVLLA